MKKAKERIDVTISIILIWLFPLLFGFYMISSTDSKSEGAFYFLTGCFMIIAITILSAIAMSKDDKDQE